MQTFCKHSTNIIQTLCKHIAENSCLDLKLKEFEHSRQPPSPEIPTAQNPQGTMRTSSGFSKAAFQRLERNKKRTERELTKSEEEKASLAGWTKGRK